MQMLCSFCLTAIPALQLAGQLGALTGQTSSSSSSQQTTMPGFELVSYGVSLLSWLLCSIVFVSERSSFERDGQWLIKFCILLVSSRSACALCP